MCVREGGKETERVREIVINLTTGKQLYFFGGEDLRKFTRLG